MISANGGLPAHRYTPQVTQRWPRGSEPASPGGAYPSLAPSQPLGAGPSRRPSHGFPALPAVVARCRLAGVGGGEGRCVLGAVLRVIGQRLAGSGAVGLLSRSVPPSSLPLEVGRAPLPHCTVGGAVGRRARLRWGGRPA